MNLTLLIKLISVILTVSLASERLVTFLKTLFPVLASKPNDPDAPVPLVVEGGEKWRQVIVMIIAFLSAWLTASFLKDGQFKPFESYDVGPPQTLVPIWVIGLLASGGSAFWTNLLGYVRAVKDISTQKSLRQKMATNQLLRAQPVKQ